MKNKIKEKPAWTPNNHMPQTRDMTTLQPPVMFQFIKSWGYKCFVSMSSSHNTLKLNLPIFKMGIITA